MAADCYARFVKVLHDWPEPTKRRDLTDGAVQNLGVLTPRAGTDGGPTARRQRDPVQVFRWRSRSGPSTSDERLVVTTACAAVRSFVGATATAR